MPTSIFREDPDQYNNGGDPTRNFIGIGSLGKSQEVIRYYETNQRPTGFEKSLVEVVRNPLHSFYELMKKESCYPFDLPCRYSSQRIEPDLCSSG